MGMRERKAISVDDAVVVEAVDGIEDEVDNSNDIMLGELSFCEDTVKDMSAGDELKGEIAFCARLESS